jgi:hypothetical protein
MSSVLCFRKTPTATSELGSCKKPLKAIFARRYYDHDGSCGGDMLILTGGDLEWLRGVRDGMLEINDHSKLMDKIIQTIEGGNTVDMWFEM